MTTPPPSTESPWLSYVPRHTAQDLLAHPGQSPIGREQRFQAVALFADVSGFTAMSEALGRAGKLGTEELTGVLNSYFEPMITLIESFGGIIGKFGGDALTVLFPFTTRTRRVAVRRALQCALDMQADMGRYAAIATSGGTFSLAMKAGLALGPVLVTTVGDPETRLEYLIAGRVLDLCADAEHHATKGEVVAENSLRAALGPDEAQIVERRGDFTCIGGLKPRARRAPLRPTPPVPPEAAPLLARYIHPAIAERVRSGLSGFINEHRKVTVLFVSFSGFDYDQDPQVGARLQAYLADVVAVIQRYDGYLNKVDMGDKGSKYIVLFGTPVAHENDEERAVRCALDLVRLPYPVRVGVNTGLAYCGQVGSSVRQEYTVIGDAVNLAARLMQAAHDGQILVSGAAYRPVARAFQWETLEPIRVKGKSEPIEVYAAQAVREGTVRSLQEHAYALPMVGREDELRVAVEALDQARAGHGQVVGVSAEAGMGKSRLAAEVVNAALARGFGGFAGACQSYGTQTSYLVWRDLWRGFFGLTPGASADEQARELEAALRALDRRLVQRLPLLGVVLNLPLPDNDLTRPLDAQLRAELLKSLLLDGLRRRLQAGLPLLLMLEDCHWIDPPSQELLEFLGRNVADLPVLLLVIYRPAEEGGGPLSWAAQAAPGGANVSEIQLSELAEVQSERLIRLKLEQLWGRADDVPEAFIHQIGARAQGNPFYLEELVNYLRDKGLDPARRDAPTLAALELPESLQSLILSRIDQLSEAAKTSLKIASVIGRMFRASWLWGAYPAVGAPEAVLRQLEDLSQLDLTPLKAAAPELEYIFKHLTTQEVAYESLAYATRASLHEAVGQFIEAQYLTQRGQFVDVLAYHFGRSHNVEKQKEYFRLAGDAAKGAYNNAAAVDYYQRLIPLLPDPAQAEVWLALGEVWQLTGQWPEAEDAFRQALARAEDQADLRARVQTALGSLLSRTQSYAEALRWLSEALATFEALDDQRGIGQAMEQLSFAHFNQGDFARALEYAQRQLEIATRQSDADHVSGALDYMGIAYLQLGEFERAREHLQRSLEEATRIGHRRRMVIAYNDLAGAYWMQDDYPSALTHLQQSLSIAHDIGYLQFVGVALGNAGSVYKQYGDYERALTGYAQALRIAAELGDAPSIVLHLANMANVFRLQGRLNDADRLAARAANLARALNLPGELGLSLFVRADTLTDLGRLPAAAAVNEEVLALTDQNAERELQLLSRVLAVRLRVALGETATSAALEELAALRAEWTADNELAVLYYEAWRLDHEQAAARQSAAELNQALYARTADAAAQERYAELTGEQLPPPPPLPPLPDSITQIPVDLEALFEKLGVEADGP